MMTTELRTLRGVNTTKKIHLCSKKVFVLNGVARSGKDTFKEMLNDYTNVFSISTVDGIKKASRLLGCSMEKNDSNRLAWSELKQLANKYFNYSEQYITKKLKEFKSSNYYDIMTIDIREPKEINYFCGCYGFESVLIKRDEVENYIPNNQSDLSVSDYDKYDYVLYNNGTLEEFRYTVYSFLKSLCEWRG